MKTILIILFITLNLTGLVFAKGEKIYNEDYSKRAEPESISSQGFERNEFSEEVAEEEYVEDESYENEDENVKNSEYQKDVTSEDNPDEFEEDDDSTGESDSEE